MSEIQHSQFAAFLEKEGGAALPGVYLIHGQEMLVEQSTLQLSTRLLDGASAQMCREKVDGMLENLPDVLERLNTYALLSGPRIVIFNEAKLFEGKAQHQQIVDRVADAWDGNDMTQAARQFLSLCGRLEIDLAEAVRGHKDHEALKSLRVRLGGDAIDKLVDQCQSKGWQPAVAGDQAAALQRAIERGFPAGHYLIVTVHAKVPKNLKLYKAFRDHGAVIDCNVPTGERRADKAAQEAVLRRTLDELLSAAGKKMSPGAFQYLCRFTGFDPRTFAQNVEKLVDYAGKRETITEEDIQAAVKRTKADPVFDLTNAVADRNLAQSLFYAQALLDAKWHPLQILSALANQMRKLLVAKSFATGSHGKSWTAGMRYPQFQNYVMPAIEAHDKHYRDMVAGWQQTSGEMPGKGRGQKKATTDVVLAANPRNPYPVYQTLLKSHNFSLQELIASLQTLNRADLGLKSSAQDHTLILKKAIMEICGIAARQRP
jgi:DNA polymerase III subunit delta